MYSSQVDTPTVPVNSENAHPISGAILRPRDGAHMTNENQTPTRWRRLEKLGHEVQELWREHKYVDLFLLLGRHFGILPVTLLVFIAGGFCSKNHLYYIGFGQRQQATAAATPAKDPPDLTVSCPEIPGKWILHLRDATEAYAQEEKHHGSITDYRVGYIRTATFPYRSRGAEWSLKAGRFSIRSEYGFLASKDDQRFIILDQRNTPSSELSFRVPQAEQDDHLFTIVLVTSNKSPITGNVCEIITSALR
jgi:hypothetical protein